MFVSNYKPKLKALWSLGDVSAPYKTAMIQEGLQSGTFVACHDPH